MKGKRKREGMRERSIGRVVKTEAVRSQGGRGGKSSVGQVSHSIGRPARFQIRFARPSASLRDYWPE